MARVSGVDLDNNWRIDYALTKIKGISWASSSNVLLAAKISPEKRVKDLSSEDINAISSELSKYVIEGELVRKIRQNIQRLISIGSYKGLRHNRGLPARGQRTKTNARTKRGKRKTVGAFKKEVLAKIQTAKKEEKK